MLLSGQIYVYQWRVEEPQDSLFPNVPVEDNLDPESAFWNLNLCIVRP